MRKKMRGKFADAFAYDWKGAGLEAEARRLLTLQQAVRGLGDAGMSSKATAEAATKLIADVQRALKTYDSSTHDAPRKWRHWNGTW